MPASPSCRAPRRQPRLSLASTLTRSRTEADDAQERGGCGVLRGYSMGSDETIIDFVPEDFSDFGQEDEVREAPEPEARPGDVGEAGPRPQSSGEEGELERLKRRFRPYR